MENPGITSYNVSASPHIKDSSSTSDIMRDVLIAMLPTTVYGIWQFGLNSLIVVVLTVATAVLAEYLYQKFMKKPSTIRDLFVEKYSKENGKYFGVVGCSKLKYDDVFDYNPFDELAEFEFEGCNFFAPKKYDGILKKYYGDYMKLSTKR